MTIKTKRHIDKVIDRAMEARKAKEAMLRLTEQIEELEEQQASHEEQIKELEEKYRASVEEAAQARQAWGEECQALEATVARLQDELRKEMQKTAGARAGLRVALETLSRLGESMQRTELSSTSTQTLAGIAGILICIMQVIQARLEGREADMPAEETSETGSKDTSQ